MRVAAAGSLRGVHGVGKLRSAAHRGPSGRRPGPSVVLAAGFAVLCFVAVAVSMAAPLAMGPAGAQEPEPSTSTSVPEPTTTAPPTTSPPTTVPTTETPTTVPTTEAPAPTAPPTTSGGGGGTVGPAVTSSVTTTEAPTTTATTESPTVVAPAPGAVTVPDIADSDAAAEPSGPWLTPDTQLRIAVGGLVALALVMVVLTIAYWRHTRPQPPRPLVGLDDDAVTDLTATDLIADPAVDLASTDPDVALAQRPVRAAAPDGAVPTSVVGFSAAPPSALPPPRLGGSSSPVTDPPRPKE